MTFAGIFHLIAKGMPEAISNAGLRAQPTEDGWRSRKSIPPAGRSASTETHLFGLYPREPEGEEHKLSAERVPRVRKRSQGSQETIMTRRLSIGRHQWSSEEPACLLSVIFRSAGVVGGIVGLEIEKVFPCWD